MLHSVILDLVCSQWPCGLISPPSLTGGKPIYRLPAHAVVSFVPPCGNLRPTHQICFGTNTAVQYRNLVPLWVFLFYLCTVYRFTLNIFIYNFPSNCVHLLFCQISCSMHFSSVTSGPRHGLKDLEDFIWKLCMDKTNKRYLFSCCASYSIPSNLASNNRTNFCWIPGGRHMETNRSMSRKPWDLSKIASVILITSLYVLVNLSAERTVLLIMDKRSTNMYSKMVPSATNTNQRMYGLAVALRSDSRTKSKA